jgi:hypothetical protein
MRAYVICKHACIRCPSVSTGVDFALRSTLSFGKVKQEHLCPRHAGKRKYRQLYSFWTLALDGGETGRMVWCLMDKNWERWAPRESGVGLSWRCVSQFACRDWGKVRKTSVRTHAVGPFRRLNPKPPKYEASVLTSRPQCSVHKKTAKYRPTPINRSQSARTLWSSWQINTPRLAELVILFRTRNSITDSWFSISCFSCAPVCPARRSAALSQHRHTNGYITYIPNEHL